MKAAVYKKYGSPNVLKIQDVPKPVTGESEVLVKIHASSVTSGDARMRRADPFVVRFFNGPIKPMKMTILGNEFAGVIEKVGKDVKLFKKGDHVFGANGTTLGTNAEYISLLEDGPIIKKPKSITFEQAVAIPFGGLAALHFLRKANIKKGQKVLIYGASGALGTSAVQIAKYFDADVTGVSSGKNEKLVKSLGADNVIDYTQEYELRPDAYDVVFDTLGKSSFSQSINSLKKNGVFLGAVHINPALVVKGLWTGATTKKKVIGGVAPEKKEDLQFLANLVEKKKLRPVIDKSFPLEKIVEAHEYVDKGHKKGAVVIEI